MIASPRPDVQPAFPSTALGSEDRGESDLLVGSSRGGRARQQCEPNQSLGRVNAQADDRFVPGVGLGAGDARVVRRGPRPRVAPGPLSSGPKVTEAERGGFVNTQACLI